MEIVRIRRLYLQINKRINKLNKEENVWNFP